MDLLLELPLELLLELLLVLPLLLLLYVLNIHPPGRRPEIQIGGAWGDWRTLR